MHHDVGPCREVADGPLKKIVSGLVKVDEVDRVIDVSDRIKVWPADGEASHVHVRAILLPRCVLGQGTPGFFRLGGDETPPPAEQVGGRLGRLGSDKAFAERSLVDLADARLGDLIDDSNIIG